MQPTPAPTGPSACDVCQEVVQDWKKSHGLTASFEEETHRVALRANTWISPLSVAAGVMDVFSACPVVPRLTKETIQDLGDRLGMRLREEGLLLAQPRRGGVLA